jgi:hypothetical protein
MIFDIVTLRVEDLAEQIRGRRSRICQDIWVSDLTVWVLSRY